MIGVIGPLIIIYLGQYYPGGEIPYILRGDLFVKYYNL